MKSSPRLRAYILALSSQDKARFAALSGTTRGHLRQISGGWRRPSPEMARRMVEASRVMYPAASRMSLHDVRPDLWEPKRRAVKIAAASITEA